jgi:hypothetical protein
MSDVPRQGGAAQIWRPGTGQDPAQWLLDPGHWDARNKRMSPGQLRHARPWLDTGRRIFIWPTGTEGFARRGQSQLGLHHYIGDQYVDAQVIHRDEARIEMTGVFPGTSAQDNMAEFVNALNDDPPEAGMILNVPGAFDQVKFVVPETWDFTHDQDDQTHSISYSVVFVMIGEGRLLTDPTGNPPPPNPSTSTKTKGKNARVFVVKDNARTFRAIARVVYKQPGPWIDVNYSAGVQKLTGLNQKLIQKHGVPAHQVPTHRWAIGTKVNY